MHSTCLNICLEQDRCSVVTISRIRVVRRSGPAAHSIKYLAKIDQLFSNYYISMIMMIWAKYPLLRWPRSINNGFHTRFWKLPGENFNCDCTVQLPTAICYSRSVYCWSINLLSLYQAQENHTWLRLPRFGNLNYYGSILKLHRKFIITVASTHAQ